MPKNKRLPIPELAAILAECEHAKDAIVEIARMVTNMLVQVFDELDIEPSVGMPAMITALGIDQTLYEEIVKKSRGIFDDECAKSDSDSVEPRRFLFIALIECYRRQRLENALNSIPPEIFEAILARIVKDLVLNSEANTTKDPGIVIQETQKKLELSDEDVKGVYADLQKEQRKTIPEAVLQRMFRLAYERRGQREEMLRILRDEMPSAPEDKLEVN